MLRLSKWTSVCHSRYTAGGKRLAEQLPLQQLPDGSVQIRHERQRTHAGELAYISQGFTSGQCLGLHKHSLTESLHRLWPDRGCYRINLGQTLSDVCRARYAAKAGWHLRAAAQRAAQASLASLRRALEAEAAQTEGDAAHALVQKLVSCAASEAPGTQELAALLLDMYLEAVQAGKSKARGERLIRLLARPSHTPK